SGDPRRSLEGMLPTYSGLLSMLANPVYAGAYAYGRNGRETKPEDGRRRVRNGVRPPREKWRVLLHDRHEGYIDWEEFERNLCVSPITRTETAMPFRVPIVAE